MTQITLNIEDKSLLPSLRKVLASIPGVSIMRNVSTKKQVAKPKTSYEKAIEDIDNGRLYEYDSLEDFIKEMEL